MSVGYAMTYFFGTLGTILALRYLPLLVGIDLAGELVRLAREPGLNRKRASELADAASFPIIRVYASRAKGSA